MILRIFVSQLFGTQGDDAAQIHLALQMMASRYFLSAGSKKISVASHKESI